ncbi:conserved hypothetical protein [Hyphomicrobiales bacterium]|nr:conserved hypothetical protein [Hyphomicrobiales bacterium]CAH1691686.1 conserved hypothetical protein [Hyphomicrobiales bacterium]
MLGQLISSLDEPDVALRLLVALDETALQRRIDDAAAASGRTREDILASTVRGFLETASDDEWLQLIGIMGRATDPGLAAMRAILEKALPGARELP